MTGETFMLAGEPGERAIASRSPDPQTGEELRWRLELPEGEEGDGENR